MTRYEEGFTLLHDHLAWSPNILDVLAAEIKKQGFVGDPSIPQLVYLAHVTSMLNKPTSMVIKGPSGAGKSFSLDMGQQFVPPSAYERIEGMSDKALVYMSEFNLKHKHLVIGEAAGFADGQGRTFLRQLISENKVRYLTVEKTDKGMKGAERSSVEGPMGVIMTTTQNALHPEDESRMISVSVRESADQIGEALVAQALGSGKSPYKPDLEQWFELFEFIKQQPKDVSIPFAEQLAKSLPRSHERIKRDFPQILSLIKACALVHQHTRTRNEDGRVVASLDDYGIVKRLLGDSLSQNLAKSVQAAVRNVVEAVAEIRNHVVPGVFDPVTIFELSDFMGRERSAVSRAVQAAIADGFLEDLNPGQGRIAQLVMGPRKMPSSEVLPPVESLSAA